ncbi:MAG TPA: peptidase M16, partial [Desulfobacterales bacterium]|nr:peptidase M16 [Desulfobacterales bacterium]
MSPTHGFELIEKKEIQEYRTEAGLYRHIKTGAQLLSLVNDDENKVFGITFRTPPHDSTGVAHILEHCVLCGSRKYPVKEPFVELLKGSLQTFLNAFTYPDKTCYPVASQNHKDFYNLIDVYLDAVFYPLLDPYIFKQEGWHLEAESLKGPFQLKGVVFNEMKGAYSSPDSVLSEYSLQSLFPDSPYGFDSGGNPKEIPNLTYEQFKAFHERFYHPSNSRIFFYGDDDPETRFKIIDHYLKDFEPLEIDSRILPQHPFPSPRVVERPYMVGEDTDSPKAMVTCNWVLGETAETLKNFSLRVLEYILLGMPGSPLRKALIESGLGEDLAGDGLGAELLQIYFSTGLKGVDEKELPSVPELVKETLTKLAEAGIDQGTVEAGLNAIEFRLRENNPGRFPRGLVLMLRALTTWLYDHDPFAMLCFEKPLSRIRASVEKGNYFEG